MNAPTDTEPATCPSQYEPEARPALTHTCELASGHEGEHLCPTCQSAWMPPKPIVTREQAVTLAERERILRVIEDWWANGAPCHILDLIAQERTR